jgi:hypothetical protein
VQLLLGAGFRRFEVHKAAVKIFSVNIKKAGHRGSVLVESVAAILDKENVE